MILLIYAFDDCDECYDRSLFVSFDVGICVWCCLFVDHDNPYFLVTLDLSVP